MAKVIHKMKRGTHHHSDFHTLAYGPKTVCVMENKTWAFDCSWFWKKVTCKKCKDGRNAN